MQQEDKENEWIDHFQQEGNHYQQEFFCSIQGCHCQGRHPHHLKRCSTIDEVSEPTNTMSVEPHLFSSQPNDEREQVFSLWNHQFSDCIAYHTRSKERLPPDPHY
uniref:Predicted protein n=1 Tax=Hordeum vulgare subsp. vulgare TaxID=112509 RepID=F2E4E9_HORVV|nr:predicted protein [Hordeum vulgare subsp. vulgare]